MKMMDNTLLEEDLKVGEYIEILDEKTEKWNIYEIKAIGVPAVKLMQKDKFLSNITKDKKTIILLSKDKITENNKKEIYIVFYPDNIVFEEEDNVRKVKKLKGKK